MGRLNARYTDGVAAGAEALFQFFRVLHQRQHLETPIAESKEHAKTHVVDTGLRVDIALVGLLKHLIGADAEVMQLAKVLNAQGREIDIDAADLAVAYLHRVKRFQGVENVANPAGVGFSCHQQ